MTEITKAWLAKATDDDRVFEIREVDVELRNISNLDRHYIPSENLWWTGYPDPYTLCSSHRHDLRCVVAENKEDLFRLLRGYIRQEMLYHGDKAVRHQQIRNNMENFLHQEIGGPDDHQG